MGSIKFHLLLALNSSRVKFQTLGKKLLDFHKDNAILSEIAALATGVYYGHNREQSLKMWMCKLNYLIPYSN